MAHTARTSKGIVAVRGAGGSARIGITEEAMDTSTEPVSPELNEGPIQAAAQIENMAAPRPDVPSDLYAESELQLRHERTERMIRRAQEQV